MHACAPAHWYVCLPLFFVCLFACLLVVVVVVGGGGGGVAGSVVGGGGGGGVFFCVFFRCSCSLLCFGLFCFSLLVCLFCWFVAFLRHIVLYCALPAHVRYRRFINIPLHCTLLYHTTLRLLIVSCPPQRK